MYSDWVETLSLYSVSGRCVGKPVVNTMSYITQCLIVIVADSQWSYPVLATPLYSSYKCDVCRFISVLYSTLLCTHYNPGILLIHVCVSVVYGRLCLAGMTTLCTGHTPTH